MNEAIALLNCCERSGLSFTQSKKGLPRWCVAAGSPVRSVWSRSLNGA
ncbi:hypothetical protein [Streptomyces violaceusniger]|nr:hypothetical protein [Streptomyces violaceusniger]